MAWRSAIGLGFSLIATDAVLAVDDVQSSGCARQLTTLVRELDQLLASDIRSVDPIQSLLNRSFPLSGCDFDESTKICRQSKFGKRLEDAARRRIDSRPRDYICQFGSANIFGHGGFHVQFSLNEQSGIFSFPFVKVNK